MNKTRSLLILFIFLALAIVIPMTVSAKEIITDSSLLIEEGEIIKNNIYVLSEDVTINGEVEGDVFCLSKSLFVSGIVHGDIICAAEDINISGKVKGNLRVASAKATISGEIDKNVNVLAKNFVLPRLAVIHGGLLIMAEEATVDGSIDKNLEGSLTKLNVSGRVSGDIDLDIDNRSSEVPISINGLAHIGGNIKYKSLKKGINISDGAYINKSVLHTPKIIKSAKKSPIGIGWFYSLIVSLILGIIFSSLFPKKSKIVIDKMTKSPGKSIGLGALLFFLLPLIIITLFLTIVGIPLALILTALWIIVLYLSPIFAGIWLGHWMFENLKWQKNNLMLASVVGIFIFKLLVVAPYIGFIIGILTLFWASGAIIMSFKKPQESPVSQKTPVKTRLKKKTKTRKLTKKSK